MACAVRRARSSEDVRAPWQKDRRRRSSQRTSGVTPSRGLWRGRVAIDLSKLPPPAVLLKSPQAQAQCAKLIKSDSIELNRGLQSNVPPLGYVNLLGTEFLRALMSLDESTWLDGGCGHLRAQVDCVTRYRTWLPRLPSMAAITTILDEETVSAAAFLSVVY